jgi:hypothetical protein
MCLMIKDKFKPNWAVKERDDYFTNAFQQPPYSFDTAFYDITSYGYPEWLIYKKSPAGAPRFYLTFSQQFNVWTGNFISKAGLNSVTGQFIQLSFKDTSKAFTGFITGVEKLDTAFYCDIELMIDDSIVSKYSSKIEPRGRAKVNEAYRVQPIKIEFKQAITPKTEFVLNIKKRGIQKEMRLVSPAAIKRD